MKELSYKDSIIKKIAKITKFKLGDIKLISSSKANANSQDFDCHEFNYNGKKYLLVNDKLKNDNNKDID